MESEGKGEGENGEPAEGRKFEGGNSRKRKTVTAERWEREEDGSTGMEGRKGREREKEGEGGREKRSSLGQGRHDEGRRANEGANREKNANGEIGYC